MVQEVAVHLKSTHAHLPSKGSKDAAGWDLYASCAISVPARGRALVPTDVSLVIPPGYYGRIAPRSGLALKHGIDVGAGVVDSDYRGDVGVLLFNMSDDRFQVEVGDRVAQIIFTPCPMMTLIEQVALPTTERGVSGFGSTGQ